MTIKGAIVAFVVFLFGGVTAFAAEHAILLHGLARSSESMKTMEEALLEAGFTVDNLDYPSTERRIEALAESAVGRALSTEDAMKAERVHFVTHSMGGILVRAYLKNHVVKNMGRVVMLGPPNSGSEVVDHLRDWWIFDALHGPAGQELGTAPDSLVKLLGPVNFELGVIAGDRSINWINSLFMIPGADDGKVSVEATKVAGMTDHVVINATHPFIMMNDEAIVLTKRFLRTGRFGNE